MIVIGVIEDQVLVLACIRAFWSWSFSGTGFFGDWTLILMIPPPLLVGIFPRVLCNWNAMNERPLGSLPFALRCIVRACNRN